MPGARPLQAALTRDSTRSKTEEARRVVEGMVEGLNDHVIDGIGAFFDEKFRWMGYVDCGTKIGLKAFRDNLQHPFQAAFSDTVCIDEASHRQRWMDGRLRLAAGHPFGRVHGHRTHRQTGGDSLHGRLARAGWKSRGQLGHGRLPRHVAATARQCFQRSGVGGLRRGSASVPEFGQGRLIAVGAHTVTFSEASSLRAAASWRPGLHRALHRQGNNFGAAVGQSQQLVRALQ